MDLGIAFIAALVGYLLGSISFARLVTYLVAPGTDISKIEEPMPDSDYVFTSDSVSATAVRMHVSTRFGCLTAILDMLKVAIPVLAFRIWQPEIPYFLITAAAGLVGHNFPIYFKFKGGRGESPIYGALLVITPLGVVITTLAGFLIGVLSGNILVLRWAGLVLMIPWMWFTISDPAYLAYIVFANLVYWISMSPELRQYYEMLQLGDDPSQEEIASSFGMGARLGRLLDRGSLPALYARMRNSEKSG